MSVKLDELRKRLLQQPPPELAVPELHPAPAPPIAEPAPARPAKSLETIVTTSQDSKAVETKPAESPKPASEADGAKSPAAAAAKPVKHEEQSKAGNLARQPAPARTASEPPRPEPEVSPPSPAQPSSAAEAAIPQNQLAEAVATVFEQTTTARLQFDELTRTLSQLGKIGATAQEIIEPLMAFHAQLAELAASFGPMRALQAQLGRMAETFEPMKVLHDQMSELADAIHVHLAELVGALDPATEFRGRILSLARSFDNAGGLQADFGRLCSTFRDDDREPRTNGLDKRSNLPH